MECVVRKDYNSHCALEFRRGLKLVSYIAATSLGPRISTSRTAEFDKEFSVINYPPNQAAIRFLQQAQAAYEYDGEVISTLMEIIMGKAMKDMTVLELTLAYNDIAKALGAKPRKSFTSKAEAIKAVEALDKKARTATPAQVKVAASKEEAVNTRKAKLGIPAAKGERKAREPGVGTFIIGLLLEGKLADDKIIAKAQAKFPDKKVGNSYPSWYRNKLRKEGRLPTPKKGK